MTLVKVKICGLTNPDDALCAIDAGADLLGFIFYPKSPRHVTIQAAREIVEGAREHFMHLRDARRVTLVGVFVNESPAHMLDVLDETRLDVAQLHGNETPDDLHAMDGRGFKALKASTAHTTPQFVLDVSSLILLDADHATLYGGTGLRADESMAAELARQYRLLLSGGLNPDNVADAIRAVRPWGVDVASGVEASPGRKDHAKVRAFIAAAKSVSE
jgi:phosphoribosylanthranilate isomerase